MEMIIMINLIRRDLILQKKLLWLYIPFVLFFVLMASSPFLIFTLAALYIPFNAFAYDEKAESDKLLNSLPYTRLEIISARYLGALFYTLVSAVLVGILMFIFSKPFGVYDFLFGGSLFLLMAALTFPLFQIFKQGNITSIILMVFVVGTVVLGRGSEVLSNYVDINLLMNNEMIPFIFAAVVVIIYAISWLTTYRIYEKKDF